jgi:membrane-associated PAP2 superfamily phosphatase
MNRTGLLSALIIAAVVGLPFGIFPQLDIELSRPFYKGDIYWVAHGPIPLYLREAVAWIIAAIAACAFISVVIKLVWPRRSLLIGGRGIVLMIATLALAPGLLSNLILKDKWGRPRPVEVTVFGGTEEFVAWWDPRGSCPKNCSFVAGEPSGAFWTLAPAALVPPPWRALAYGAALTFGAAVGLLRMSAGGHFFTDVVFAGVFTFLIVWLVHGLLYRWRATRITDDSVEHAIESVSLPFHRTLLRLITRTRDPAARKEKPLG